MNIPTQTNDPESGIAPDTDEGSSRLSRRNVILGGVAVVAAINLPKNSLASTPLSMTDQPSKNNHGKDDNMNSTTDIPETAQTFDPTSFTVVPARTFEDLRVGEIFRAPSAHSPMRMPQPSRPFRLTSILFTTTSSMRGVMDTQPR